MQLLQIHCYKNQVPTNWLLSLPTTRSWPSAARKAMPTQLKRRSWALEGFVVRLFNCTTFACRSATSRSRCCKICSNCWPFPLSLSFSLTCDQSKLIIDCLSRMISCKPEASFIAFFSTSNFFKGASESLSFSFLGSFRASDSSSFSFFSFFSYLACFDHLLSIWIADPRGHSP